MESTFVGRSDRRQVGEFFDGHTERWRQIPLEGGRNILVSVGRKGTLLPQDREEFENVQGASSHQEMP